MVKNNSTPLVAKLYQKPSGFARFNTIITSLKALDEGFSSKNYVRKFLRALHPKWRAKVTGIEKSKDFSSLALDELIGNLKVHEVVLEKDSKIYKGKKKRVKSVALKAKKESSDDETLISGSDDEKYDMAVRNFKKFFRRKGKFVRQPREEKKSFRQRDEKKGKSDRKCFRCGDPNHVIGNCLKPSRNKDKKAFIRGSWSDSKNDTEYKTNNETYLMAQSSNEVCLRTCLEPDEWIKDSGCSKHMTDNNSLFSTYEAYDGALAISTTKAEYISAGKECRQALWMKQALIDYGIRLDDVPIMCDNKGAINLSKIPIQHSRTKHIEIRHHFLRDYVQKGNISIEKVASEDNIADIFTKPLKGTKMPSEYQQDYKKTCAYAPKIYNEPNMSDTLRDIYRTLESRYVYKGRNIDPSFYNDLSDDSVAKLTAIGFECLLSLDEQICPRFIFEFYKTLKLERDSNNHFSFEFIINNHLFNLSLTQFSKLTYLLNQGIYIYSDAWGLDELEKTLEQIEPYNSSLPALDDIRNLIHRRTVHEKIDKEGSTIHKLPNQIETNKLFDHLRPYELVIRENVYSAIGNRDHTQAVIALMLYCLENKQPFNLAYFIIRRTYFFRDRRDKVLLYGMILTRLFKNLKANMAQGLFKEHYKFVPT
ncbi:copia protein [Tanacetum coccineum]